jgi:AraC family transcriptional regulator of adaptative response / DNA-3-methyladenine glycosylase II
VASGAGHAVVCVRALDAAHALELRVCGASPAALFPLSRSARRVFDLAADPARIAVAFQGDSLLAPLVKQRPGLRIPGAWDPFECAVRAVLDQQVGVAAARSLAGRLVSRVGRRIDGGGDGLTHVFPTAAELAAADLAGLGLAPARVCALRALATAVAEGLIDFEAPVEEVTAALAALPGVGDWTAQYVALRGLGEPDAFPAADLVLRRVVGAGAAPLSARSLESRGRAWRPWRGYAVAHLWRAAADAARPSRISRLRKRPAGASQTA